MRQLTLLAGLALLLAGGLSCSDSPTGGTTAISSDPVTIANAMPTTVGSTWTYALSGRVYADDLNSAHIYETEAEVPPGLSLDAVIALAANHPRPTLLQLDTGTLDWSLSVAIPAGDTLGCLFDSVEDWPTRADYRYFGPGAEQIWIGPDWLGYPPNGPNERLPLLEGGLQAGDTFTQDLVGELQLFVRVLGEQAVSTPAGVYANALACFYYVDYGVLGLVDPEGGPEVVGYLRGFDYGTVHWVADLGPVRATYREGMTLGDDGVDAGLREITVSLTNSSLQD